MKNIKSLVQSFDQFLKEIQESEQPDPLLIIAFIGILKAKLLNEKETVIMECTRGHVGELSLRTHDPGNFTLDNLEKEEKELVEKFVNISIKFKIRNVPPKRLDAGDDIRYRKRFLLVAYW